jgi:hypothetical protein
LIVTVDGWDIADELTTYDVERFVDVGDETSDGISGHESLQPAFVREIELFIDEREAADD